MRDPGSLIGAQQDCFASLELARGHRLWPGMIDDSFPDNPRQMGSRAYVFPRGFLLDRFFSKGLPASGRKQCRIIVPDCICSAAFFEFDGAGSNGRFGG
jgi:hypothetical protein